VHFPNELRERFEHVNFCDICQRKMHKNKVVAHFGQVHLHVEAYLPPNAIIPSAKNQREKVEKSSQRKGFKEKGGSNRRSSDKGHASIRDKTIAENSNSMDLCKSTATEVNKKKRGSNQNTETSKSRLREKWEVRRNSSASDSNHVSAAQTFSDTIISKDSTTVSLTNKLVRKREFALLNNKSKSRFREKWEVRRNSSASDSSHVTEEITEQYTSDINIVDNTNKFDITKTGVLDNDWPSNGEVKKYHTNVSDMNAEKYSPTSTTQVNRKAVEIVSDIIEETIELIGKAGVDEENAISGSPCNSLCDSDIENLLDSDDE